MILVCTSVSLLLDPIIILSLFFVCICQLISLLDPISHFISVNGHSFQVRILRNGAILLINELGPHGSLKVRIVKVRTRAVEVGQMLILVVKDRVCLLANHLSHPLRVRSLTVSLDILGAIHHQVGSIGSLPVKSGRYKVLALSLLTVFIFALLQESAILHLAIVTYLVLQQRIGSNLLPAIVSHQGLALNAHLILGYVCQIEP